MNLMTLDIYKNFIGSDAATYMLRQTLVILFIFLMGFIVIGLVNEGIDYRMKELLSYPLGLAMFSVLGFLLLILGIRFEFVNILGAYCFLIAGLMIYRIRSGKGFRLPRLPYRMIFILIPALFASSGILPQIISNDSVYYYSVYPSILVSDGFLSPSLDKFLTDVGQTTAVIESLPFMAGFDESFGIQHFLTIDFIFIFYEAVFECVGKDGKRLFRFIIAALCTLFLITSEPFLVLSAWILSNAFFMEMLFIAVFLILKTSGAEDSHDGLDFIIFFLIAMLSMCRMEGGVMVFVLAISFSALPISKMRLIKLFGIPLAVMEFGYYVNLYLRMGVNPLYSFLDMKAAVLMVALIILLFVYIIFIRDRLPRGYVPVLLLGMLLLGNVGLLIINHGRYLTNLKAFIMNIRLGNGWGVFAIVIAAYMVIFVYECIKRRFKDIPIEIFLTAALTLAVFGVCFARGGVLAIRTSDSGNRVLMELTPLIVYSVFWWMIDKCGQDEENREGAYE